MMLYPYMGPRHGPHNGPICWARYGSPIGALKPLPPALNSSALGLKIGCPGPPALSSFPWAATWVFRATHPRQGPYGLGHLLLLALNNCLFGLVRASSHEQTSLGLNNHVAGLFCVLIGSMCISKTHQLRTTTNCSWQISAEQTHPYAEQTHFYAEQVVVQHSPC
jgi:hypothetical protein